MKEGEVTKKEWVRSTSKHLTRNTNMTCARWSRAGAIYDDGLCATGLDT